MVLVNWEAIEAWICPVCQLRPSRVSYFQLEQHGKELGIRELFIISFRQVERQIELIVDLPYHKPLVSILPSEVRGNKSRSFTDIWNAFKATPS